MLNIPLNTRFTKEMVVQEEHLASTFGSGRVRVFATPYMVAFIEATCNEGSMAYQDDNFATVGAIVNVKHLKPTPLGMKVYCEAFFKGIDDKGLYVYEAKVYDNVELVGVCEHKRGLINIKEFTERAYNKDKK